MTGDNEIDQNRMVKKLKHETKNGKLVISDNLVCIGSSSNQQFKNKDDNVVIGAVSNNEVLVGIPVQNILSTLSDQTKGLVQKLLNENQKSH